MKAADAKQEAKPEDSQQLKAALICNCKKQQNASLQPQVRRSIPPKRRTLSTLSAVLSRRENLPNVEPETCRCVLFGFHPRRADEPPKPKPEENRYEFEAGAGAARGEKTSATARGRLVFV